MKIGELAALSGLTASRIRFYEGSGLLRAAPRQANGYRDYAPDAPLVLHIITCAQQAGFSLEEIRQLVPADLKNWQHDKLLVALRRKVQDIEAMQARLAQSKARLKALAAEIEAKPHDVDCASNARRVLSQMLVSEKAKRDVLVTKPARPAPAFKALKAVPASAPRPAR